jgi:ubiquinone/menaquinone biosynthesis C-methylase UbiE
MIASQLREVLQSAGTEPASDASWLTTLTERKRKEIEFHDADREALAGFAPEQREQSAANRKFYAVTRGISNYMDRWILEQARDRVFLDYACGEGRAATLASRVAQLSIGIDISSKSLELARRHADSTGAGEKVIFLQADCEKTGLPDACVDAVLCSGMLHHLDLSYAMPELRRLLKPGGRVLAMEALNYNPAIRLYRRFTPSLRTEFEKEHILSFKDIVFMRRFFRVENIRYWNLATLLAVPFRHTPAFNGLLSSLESVDGALSRIPGIAQMAWMFSFELVKTAEEN